MPKQVLPGLGRAAPAKPADLLLTAGIFSYRECYAWASVQDRQSFRHIKAACGEPNRTTKTTDLEHYFAIKEFLRKQKKRGQS
jgi:hypothetical protein